MTENGDEIRVMMMAEHRVAKAIELLGRIAGHDHQAAAIRILTNRPDCPFHCLEAYADCLNEVAKTDIQGWAKLALMHLRGQNND